MLIHHACSHPVILDHLRCKHNRSPPPHLQRFTTAPVNNGKPQCRHSPSRALAKLPGRSQPSPRWLCHPPNAPQAHYTAPPPPSLCPPRASVSGKKNNITRRRGGRGERQEGRRPRRELYPFHTIPDCAAPRDTPQSPRCSRDCSRPESPAGASAASLVGSADAGELRNLAANALA